MSSSKRQTIAQSNAIQDLVQTVKDFMENINLRFDRVDTDLNGLTEDVHHLSITADHIHERQQLAATPTAAPVANDRIIPRPRNANKDSVINLILVEVHGSTMDEAHEMVDAIGRAALTCCQSAANESPELAICGWRDLPAENRHRMKAAAFGIAQDNFQHLEFIGRCLDLWPIECFMQPKWSSKSAYARRKR